MPVNLLTGLRVHYDCEEATGTLISSTTFPPGAPTTNFVEQNTVPSVDPGKFGLARGPCNGAVGAGGDGFTRTVVGSGPWDFRTGAQSFSVGAWVYLDSATGSQILFEYSGTSEDERAWALRAVHDLGGGATSPVVFFRDNDAANWNFAFAIPTDQTGIAGGQATDEWVYMAVTYNATTKFCALYYGSPTDGEHYATFDASAINSGNGPFDGWTDLGSFQTIGTAAGTASSIGTTGLLGDVDHIDVWDRALTQAEFAYAYNNGAGQTASAYVESTGSIVPFIHQLVRRRRRKRNG